MQVLFGRQVVPCETQPKQLSTGFIGSVALLNDEKVSFGFFTMLPILDNWRFRLSEPVVSIPRVEFW